ncbi:hypothetical protein [Mycolicibacillus parakoreensis]|uniref:Uncharacterized protein n=1 Tax=Mycolicibacillus parakoreensis TaxID=1069221 RepID=A0ABY3U895_9MYCO|nr:hypothetical protein [Mycolicibacillus parakoreensis]ULN53649.1 hypothetical protein MIU77_04815 [Mycolicibacillus parakoreensis]
MRLRPTASSDTPDRLPASADTEPTAAALVLSRILERSSRMQAPAVHAYVLRLRAAHPGLGPAGILHKLEKRYLRAVTASGAAVGSGAAVPGIGTLTALGAVAAETVVFLEATTLYVLAVADVFGIPVDQRERRRALVLAVLVGEDARRAVRSLMGPGRTNGAWLTEGVAAMPLPTLTQLNGRLLRYFVRRYTLKRGALAAGKMLPMGVGAVIGGGGNRVMGRKIIANTRAAFGVAPGGFPEEPYPSAPSAPSAVLTIDPLAAERR